MSLLLPRASRAHDAADGEIAPGTLMQVYHRPNWTNNRAIVSLRWHRLPQHPRHLLMSQAPVGDAAGDSSIAMPNCEIQAKPSIPGD